MRCLWLIFLSLPSWVAAAQQATTFDAARAVLEVRCVECHRPEKAKGDLVFTTRDGMIKGGEGGTAMKPGSAADSEMIKRVRLAADDDERMPPEKKGEPLSAGEIAALSQWIDAGAPWPTGEVLAARAKTALPRWDAAPDPQILSIEAFPKTVALETAADFHRLIVIAHFKDASTHDITAQAKLTLADHAVVHLVGTALTPKKDGATSLRIDYRGLTTEVPVTVKDAEKPRPISFQLNGVQHLDHERA